MALKALRETILREAHQEAGAMYERAQEEAKGLLEEEKKQGLLKKKQVKDELESALANFRQERLAWAQLEARRMEAAAREQAIKAQIDNLYEELKGISGRAYEGFLNRRLKEAVEQLGKNCTVHLQGKDKSKPKASVKMKTDLEGEYGGLKGESADGKIIFNGTLDGEVEMKYEELRKMIYESLFGGKPNGKK